MRRGDVVIVALPGDFGKPRPGVVVQTDAMPEAHGSVVVCQMTSEVVEPADFRVTVEPDNHNGLRVRSQIMADKPATVRRTWIGEPIGRLQLSDMSRLNVALAFVLGLAD